MKGYTKKSLALVLSSLVLLIALVGGTWSTAFGAGVLPAPSAAGSTFIIPTFDIVSVVTDSTVTIKTHNFPANDTFNVLMNTIGTRGIGGTSAGTINSGSGGSFTATFNIPAGLKGLQRIAIRLESPTSGFFSFNWFWNNTSSIPVTGPTATPHPFVTPTFTITSVVVDSKVTIQTANFPANDTFNVLMNVMGTRGVGGVKVDTINSGAGGTLTLTFNIPAGLKGQQRIAIRLESPTSGFFSFNWFWNNTSSGIPVTGPTAVPFVIPTFTITAVSANNTVTIKTANFPANDTFNVTMGAFGTRGIGGTSAGTFSSGTGGTQTATFTIPSNLHGLQRIAIRLQSPTSGFFSYNWFWNTTTP
ncbi:MAG TPA: hypothetical protein VF806_03295 [Anaerolineaceae bacterium]